MQVQRRLGAHDLDGVEIIGHQGAGVAAADRELALSREASDAGRGTVVSAIVEDVVLVAVDAGNDRPGRVVVRRLCLAGTARGRVEREAAVKVLRATLERTPRT